MLSSVAVRHGERVRCGCIYQQSRVLVGGFLLRNMVVWCERTHGDSAVVMELMVSPSLGIPELRLSVVQERSK